MDRPSPHRGFVAERPANVPAETWQSQGAAAGPSMVLLTSVEVTGSKKPQPKVMPGEC